jgi:hypothetical protein
VKIHCGSFRARGLTAHGPFVCQDIEMLAIAKRFEVLKLSLLIHISYIVVCWANAKDSTNLHHALQLFRTENTVLELAGPHVKLHVNSSELSKSGEWVEVSWSGLLEPQRDDLIALYVPAGNSYTQ